MCSSGSSCLQHPSPCNCPADLRPLTELALGHFVHPVVCLLQSTGQWVKLNVQQHGFFRVNYPQPLWTALATAANASASPISSSDLAGLLDDSFALSLAGVSPINTFLDLSRQV